MRTLAALAALAALLAAPAARAQPVSAPSGPDTYLQLHGGPFLPQHDDLDDFDMGYDFGLLFGARFDRHLSVEGGIGYYRTALDEASLGLATKASISVLPFTASLRLRLPFKHAELSALGGIGLHVSRLSQDVTIGPDTSSDSASSTVFGFHVGAGAAFNLWRTTLFGVEVVHTFAEAKFDGVATRLDGLRAALTLTYLL